VIPSTVFSALAAGLSCAYDAEAMYKHVKKAKDVFMKNFFIVFVFIFEVKLKTDF
jgi:hypothetical protein